MSAPHPLYMRLDQPHGDAARIGGKASGLANLIRHGVRVPPGFVLTTDAYELFLQANDLGAEVDRALEGVDVDDIGRLRGIADELQGVIAGADLPVAIVEALWTGYDELAAATGRDDPPVAVRSSATGEDSAGNSFAGEYDTHLWVEGLDAVAASVRRCWASLFNASAMSYRAKRGIAQTSTSMAVTIHLMVPARAAGVMFTLHPGTGDRTKIAIEASWGLGKLVVDGEANPDLYLVDKASMTVVESRIAEKPVRCVRGPDGIPIQEPVPDELRAVPCLVEDEILELARIGKELERSRDAPQDIEWAVDGDAPPVEGLFILQCRPETVWSARARAARSAGAGLMDWVVDSLQTPS